MSEQTSLRLGVLAVSVLDDVDLRPARHGVALDCQRRDDRQPGGPAPVEVSWAECREALGDADPGSNVGRGRLARWLRLRGWLATRSSAEIRAAVRPVGLPVGHVLHPGPEWVQQRVLGDTLDLGLGLVGVVAAAPDDVAVVPPGVCAAARVETAGWWPAAARYLEHMGTMAAERLRRTSVLRPMGDCDAVTLLGAATLRAALSAGAQGMAAVAVPMRRRGWLDLSRIDPAFAPAAAAATEPVERGFDTAVLVTADEVVALRKDGRLAEIALRDRAVSRPWAAGVRYR